MVRKIPILWFRTELYKIVRGVLGRWSGVTNPKWAEKNLWISAMIFTVDGCGYFSLMGFLESDRSCLYLVYYNRPCSYSTTVGGGVVVANPNNFDFFSSSTTQDHKRQISAPQKTNITFCWNCLVIKTIQSMCRNLSAYCVNTRIADRFTLHYRNSLRWHAVSMQWVPP